MLHVTCDVIGTKEVQNTCTSLVLPQVFRPEAAEATRCLARTLWGLVFYLFSSFFPFKNRLPRFLVYCILYIEVYLARPLWGRVFYPFSLFIIYYLIISAHKFVLFGALVFKT